MADRWRIELFGPLRATRGEVVLTRFRTQKTAALLAYLAAHPGQDYSREALSELLWPDAEPESGRHNLRLALSSLRHQLGSDCAEAGPVLVADRNTVRINHDLITTDLAEFERLLTLAAAEATPGARRPLLESATDLYTGELLPGCYEAWIEPAKLRIEDLYVRAVLDLEELLREENPDSAISVGSRAIERAPLREELYVAQLTLLCQAGHFGAAARLFANLEQTLERELGVPPSAEARKIGQLLRQGLGTVRSEHAVVDVRTHAADGYVGERPRARVGGRGTVTCVVLQSTFPDPAALPAPSRQRTPHRIAPAAARRWAGRVVANSVGRTVLHFASACDALGCAVELHPRNFARVGNVRIALHSGDLASIGQRSRDADSSTARAAGGDASDPFEVAQEIVSVAAPGVALCSESAAALLRPHLRAGYRLLPVGVYRLRHAAGPQRLYRLVDAASESEPEPVVGATPAYSGFVPRPMSRLIGRTGDIGVLVQWLRPSQIPDNNVSPRLVTLTGPGGSGKTRLAQEAARQLAEPYSQAVWFVSLAEATGRADVGKRIRQALGVTDTATGTGLDEVVDVLSQQPALVVLDNMEHLLAGVDGAEITDLVRAILERAGGARILATSRVRLGIDGEHEFAVAPLELPGEADGIEALSRVESVALFVERATAARPDFQLTPTNAAAVADLCTRLEGLPLAIELAAARSQQLSPAQMAAHHADRLDFFATRRRDSTQRHRSLRAALDWSFDLLSPAHRDLLVRLSVFRGGWTTDAAAAVCGGRSTSEMLEHLVDHSLISADADRPGRWRMLETLRHYAEEQLSDGNLAALRRAHAAYFEEFAKRAEINLRGPEQASWLDLVEQDHDNVRVAIRNAIQDGEPVVSTHIVCAVARFWWMRGHWGEGRRLLREVAALATASPEGVVSTHELGTLAYYEGTFALEQGDIDYARKRLDVALEFATTARDTRGEARALGYQAKLAKETGDLARARRLAQRSVEIHRAAGDELETADGLSLLAFVLLSDGDTWESAVELYEEALEIYQRHADLRSEAGAWISLGFARQLQRGRDTGLENYERALEVFRGLGDVRGIALSVNNIAETYCALGEFERAREMADEALALWRRLGHKYGIAAALVDRAVAGYHLGDLEAAGSLLAESARVYADLTDIGYAARSIAGVGVVAARLGDALRAAVLLGAAAGLQSQRGAVVLPRRIQPEPTDDDLRAALGDDTFASAWSRGRAMDLESALAWAGFHGVEAQ